MSDILEFGGGLSFILRHNLEIARKSSILLYPEVSPGGTVVPTTPDVTAMYKAIFLAK